MPPERRLQLLQLQQRVGKEDRGEEETVTFEAVRRGRRKGGERRRDYLDFSAEAVACCLGRHDGGGRFCCELR